MISLTDAINGMNLKAIAATPGARRVPARTPSNRRNRNSNGLAVRHANPAQRQLQ